MTELLLYLYAESPVHAGAADSLGALDLPIQREATTAYPVIWGQSLKGALRQAATDAGWDRDLLTLVFGSPPPGADSGGAQNRGAGADDAAPEGGQAGGSRRQPALTAGGLAVGDAQLVAMPVPTLQQTFAWATSGLALARLARKYRPLDVPPLPEPPRPAAGGGLAGAAHWVGDLPQVVGPCLVEMGAVEDAGVSAWAHRLATDVFGEEPLLGFFARKLRSDLVVVGEDVMPALLRECTEFTARVQLGSGKTVNNGPFYCEYLPTETILAAPLTLRPAAAQAGERELRALLDGQVVQVGGDETIGKGLVWTRLVRSA